VENNEILSASYQTTKRKKKRRHFIANNYFSNIDLCKFLRVSKYTLNRRKRLKRLLEGNRRVLDSSLIKLIKEEPVAEFVKYFSGNISLTDREIILMGIYLLQEEGKSKVAIVSNDNSLRDLVKKIHYRGFLTTSFLLVFILEQSIINFLMDLE